MATYTVKTPNPNYSDTWRGINFVDGCGTTQDASVADAAARIGYTVTSDTQTDSKPSTGLTEASPAKPAPARKPRAAKKAE